MRILYSGTLDVTAGGPAMSTYLTMLGLQQLGEEPEIIQYPLVPGSKLRGEDVPVHFASAPCVPKIAYSPSLRKEIRVLGVYEIYHAQGIWQYQTYALIDEAKRTGRPYLITPRGMLYPQDIAKSSTFFKKLSLKWRLLDDLNNAACVHCTCEEEMRHCRELGVTAPIAVITNPVECLPQITQMGTDIDTNVRQNTNISNDKENSLTQITQMDTEGNGADRKNNLCKSVASVGKRTIGYLGRVSPRKKVERLIYAFAGLGEKAKDAELLIIGGGDEKYERFLKDEVNRLNLTNVRFTGFLSGDEKDRAIASCSVIANPSDFENLGMVILEGLVREIPCIATFGSPWENLVKHQCGWWVPATQDGITSAVLSALETPEQELRDMGKRGRLLVSSEYSVEHVAQQMKQLYEWILGKGDKPEFVYL